MRNFLPLLLCFLPIVKAAETFAWKVPVSNFAWEGLESVGVVRIENPPETSPFFNEGDELWDVSAVLPGRFGIAKDSFDWAAWNDTTGRLVAKGSSVAIHTLHYQMEVEGIPARCRHTIELFRIAEDGAPPDFSRKPDASLSLISRDGQKSSASFSKDDVKISFEDETVFSKDNSFIDTRLLISASLPDCPDIEIKTAVTIRNGSSLWIAREFDGKRGMDVRVSSEIQLLDGTPFTQAALRQEGETVKPFIVDRSPSRRLALDDGAWLAIAWVDFQTIVQLCEEAPADAEADPFSETEAESSKTKAAFDDLPRAQAPGILAPYFAGPVVNLTEKLSKMGLDLEGKDFAGYDPGTERIFLYTANKAELDKFESLFAIHHSGRVGHTAITLRGNGQMRLIARSGQIAHLKSTSSPSNLTRHLEFEPIVGESGDLVDLRLLYEEKSGEELIRSLNTATTIITGKSVELLKDTLPDGSGTSMEFRADIIGSK